MKLRLFDGHCDTAERLWADAAELAENSCHVDLRRTSEFVPYAQFFAIYGDARRITGPPWEYVKAVWTCFSQQVEKNSDRIVLCRTGEEAERAFSLGKCAAFLSVEGGELLDCDPARVAQAAALGVRAVLLTWNYDNALCGSAMGETRGALTTRGTLFVRELLKHRMLVDVSHLSEAGFWQVADLCDRAGIPFVASHSCAKALCAHPRNLSDVQFREIVRQGGVAGVNCCPEHLSESGAAGVDTVRGHIEHFLDLGGEDHVALGMDYDGIEETPAGMPDVSGAAVLYEALLRAGHPENLVQKIFFNNLMRVVKQVCIM